jgi:molecular chaperone DnaK
MSDQAPVGIDLGTTYSAVAHLDADGRPWTILNAEGDLTTPSVVFFDKTGAVVGKEALTAGEYEPERLAQCAKRDMGEDAFSKLIRGQQLPAEVVQAIILKKLKEDAELKLGSVSDVVITVPAFFNEPCRKATQDAGRLAGLNVLDIINEPTAAAICYGVQQGFLSQEGASSGREQILIYDLGGGTFDVTVMEIDGTSYRAIATAGDVYLGGVDWDERLGDHIAEAFVAEHGVDPRRDEIGNQALLLKAGEAKHSLTSRESVTLFFNYDGRRLKMDISRAEFEEMTSDLLDRTMMTVRQVLREAQLEFSQLTRLLLVGGSTRMPAVQRLLEKETGLTADRSLSPDEAVAHGAAIYAGLLMKSDARRISGMSVTNVSSHDLGILGVETATGRNRRSVMIPRNSALPVKVKKKFPTRRDGQPGVDVNVIEGGDDSGNNSTPIGRCSITGLPADLPAKTPVEVAFKYEPNGRLVVHARLPSIGVDAKLEIKRAAGLDDETIARWSELVQSGIPDGTDVEAISAPAVAAPPAPRPAEIAAPPEAAQTAAAPVRKLGPPIKSGQPLAAAQPAPPQPAPQPAAAQPAPQPQAKKKRKKAAAKPDWKDRARKLSGD